MTFASALIEIVGGVSAKDPFPAGARHADRVDGIMSTAVFARTLDRLLALDLIEPGTTCISLHNRGEPILHPDLTGIVTALNARNLSTVITTNACRRTQIEVSTAGFRAALFWVPGWSQASFDRVHGLHFPAVVANIEATMANLRATGYAGRFTLLYYAYQWNAFDELAAARAWCADHDVDCVPFLAYINDYETVRAFLEGTLAAALREEISRALFLHYLDELMAKRPPEWACPQWDSLLVVNHLGQVLRCCPLPADHPAVALGSVSELTREEILARKRRSAACEPCLRIGISYWGHAPQLVRVAPAR